MKKLLVFMVIVLLVALVGLNPIEENKEVTMDFANSGLPEEIPIDPSNTITMDFANSGLPEEIPIDPSNHITVDFHNSDLPPDIPPKIVL
jgi:hypothetical protein